MAFFAGRYFPSRFFPVGWSSGGGGGGGGPTLTDQQLLSLFSATLLPGVGSAPYPDTGVDSGDLRDFHGLYRGPFAGTTPTLAAPSRELGLVGLLDLFLDSGTKKYATGNFDATTAYVPKIVGVNALSESLPELFDGLPVDSSVEVIVSPVETGNPEAPAVATLAGAEKLRGKRARFRWYSLTLGVEVIDINGSITAYDEVSGSITISTNNTALFNTKLPGQYLRDVYPNLDLSTGRGQDPIVLVPFGNWRKVQLFLVETDGATYWRYGAVRKPLTGTTTFANVYRDGALVSTSEYTTVESPSGFLTVQFDIDQKDNGRPIPIVVDITTTEFSENPAKVLSFLLTNATYGLGQTVDAATITQAAADYDALGIRIAGGLSQQWTAKALFQLLLLHGAFLDRDSTGQYGVFVDVAEAHPQPADADLQLGLDDDGKWNNIISLTPSYRLSDRALKSLLYKGDWDPYFDNNGSWLITTKHSRTDEGVDDIRENQFIGDMHTLDVQAHYMFTRFNAQDRTFSVSTTPESYILERGFLVKTSVPRHSLNTVLEVRARGTSGLGDLAFNLTLAGYDATAFVYTAGTQFSAPNAGTLTDYRRTLPAQPTNFAVVTSVVRTGSEGIVESLVQLKADAPAVNVTHLVFQSFRSGSAIVRSEVTVPVTLGQVGVKAELSLTPGLSYDLECYAKNVNNDADRQESTRAQILNWTAAGDTTAPAPPQNLTVFHGTGRTLTLDWDDNTEDDLKTYEVWRDSSSSMGTATKIAEVAASRFVDENLVYGSTYFYGVKARDFSGNTSAYSAIMSGYVSKIASSDYSPQSVHTDHRQPNNLTVFGFTVTAHTSLSSDTGLPAPVYLYTAGVTGVQATNEWDSSTHDGSGNPNGARLYFFIASGPAAGAFDANYHHGFWNGTADDWNGAGRIVGW